MEAKSFLATQKCTKGGRVINVTSHSCSWEQHCPQHGSLQNSLAPVASKLDIPIFQLVISHLKMFTLFFLSYRSIPKLFPSSMPKEPHWRAWEGKQQCTRPCSRQQALVHLQFFPVIFFWVFNFVSLARSGDAVAIWDTLQNAYPKSIPLCLLHSSPPPPDLPWQRGPRPAA